MRLAAFAECTWLLGQVNGPGTISLAELASVLCLTASTGSATGQFDESGRLVCQREGLQPEYLAAVVTARQVLLRGQACRES